MTLLICEGPKKLIAAYRLARHNSDRPQFLACALSGVWNWRGTIGKTMDADGARVDEKGVIPDFNRITWTGRKVVVIFDSDCATNPSVSAARRGLMAELKKRGARVVVLDLPALDGLEKVGLDDLLAQRGPEHVLSLIHTAIQNPVSSSGSGAYDAKPVKELADAILREHSFAQDAGNQLYVFEGGYYRPHGQDAVARLVKTLLLQSGDAKRWSSHLTLRSCRISASRCPEPIGMSIARPRQCPQWAPRSENR